MTSAQEEYVFERFKDLYADFPDGDITKTESPDYLITLPDKKIGIEITKIFIDNDTNSSINEKRKESLHSLLGHALCEKIEPLVPFKYLMSIDFSTIGFSTNAISSIIGACEEYFKKLQFPADEINSLDIINYGQLPKEINKINLFKYPLSQSSEYIEDAGGVVPNLTLRNLQPVLEKKHKALLNYQFCNEYWLLIEEGTFYSDSFNNILIEYFETDFSKVFLSRHSRGEVLQLK